MSNNKSKSKKDSQASASASAEILFCRVCGSPANKIRAGVIACEACKKFFLRNRDNLLSMQCITNRGDCVIGLSNNNNNNSDGSNNAKRSACSRCRLVKCFSVGMRIKGNVYSKARSNRGAIIDDGQVSTRHHAVVSGQLQVEGENSGDSGELVDITSTSGNSSSSLFSYRHVINNILTRNFAGDQQQMMTAGRTRDQQQQPTAIMTQLMQNQQSNKASGVPLEPTDIERRAIHLTMKIVIEAAAQLSAFQSLPWTIRRDVIRSDHAMWELTMECFDFAVASGFAFIKQLPGYDEMPLTDRCHLFAGSFIPLVVSQVNLPGSSGTSFFGQNEYNHEIFFRCFPNFRNLESVINAASDAMKTWNPSFIEFSILQALLFYQTDTLHQLERPDLVIKINNKLKQALWAYYETNKELYLNCHHFMRAYNMLRQVETVYDVDMYVFANNRPDLIHKNRLFAEMFFLPAEGREQRWYQMNLNALEGPSPSSGGRC